MARMKVRCHRARKPLAQLFDNYSLPKDQWRPQSRQNPLPWASLSDKVSGDRVPSVNSETAENASFTGDIWLRCLKITAKLRHNEVLRPNRRMLNLSRLFLANANYC
jgi:hypothetical protein